MHHTRKKKAANLIGEEKDPAVITETLLSKEFTQEEVNEFLASLDDSGDTEKGSKGKNKSKVKSEEAEYYEEWKCEVKIDEQKKRTVEKLKKLRPKVKISTEEAETLNSGALNSPRQDHVVMYFLPGEEA